MELLNIGNNAKTPKGDKYGYRTAILYLSPATLSGKNLCPYSTAGCRAACLNTAGYGMYDRVQAGRLRKTAYFNEDRPGFMAQLATEITKFVAKTRKAGHEPVIRLNGTTDIMWERIPSGEHANIMAQFPDVQFYDYTKIPIRYRHKRPANYHLTFSLAEDNDRAASEALALGVNVAVIFRKDLPPNFMLRPVIDGDAHDLRFRNDMIGLTHPDLHSEAVVIGLKAKGKARHDTSGFVRA